MHQGFELRVKTCILFCWARKYIDPFKILVNDIPPMPADIP